MILADTGYFLALANPVDQLHDRAKAWADACSEPLIVTEYVLLETVNYLSHPNMRSRAQQIAVSVRQGSQFIWHPASEELLDKGLRLHRLRPDKHWSLTDCISFVVMQERRVSQALAHDQHFEQAGFEALLRRAP